MIDVKKEYPELYAYCKKASEEYQAELEKDFTELMDRLYGKATGNYTQKERYPIDFTVYAQGRADRQIKLAIGCYTTIFSDQDGYDDVVAKSIRKAFGIEDGAPIAKELREEVVNAVTTIFTELRLYGY